MSDALMLKLERLLARNNALSVKVVQLEQSRDKWRVRALAATVARQEARRQRDRAELWKHRALMKTPTRPRGGWPKWEDE